MIMTKTAGFFGSSIEATRSLSIITNSTAFFFLSVLKKNFFDVFLFSNTFFVTVCSTMALIVKKKKSLNGNTSSWRAAFIVFLGLLPKLIFPPFDVSLHTIPLRCVSVLMIWQFYATFFFCEVWILLCRIMSSRRFSVKQNFKFLVDGRKLYHKSITHPFIIVNGCSGLINDINIFFSCTLLN